MRIDYVKLELFPVEDGKVRIHAQVSGTGEAHSTIEIPIDSFKSEYDLFMDNLKEMLRERVLKGS